MQPLKKTVGRLAGDWPVDGKRDYFGRAAGLPGGAVMTGYPA
jgi:hypothetical protein